MRAALTTALAFLFVASAGCDEADETPPRPAASEDPDPGETAAPEPAATESPSEATAEEPSAEGEGETEEPAELPVWASAFEWTETPSVDAIPAGPVRGIANGAGFEALAIYFEPRFDNWAFVIADRPLEDHSGTLPAGAQAVNITDLPQRMASGVFRHEISTGGGFWQIARPDDPSRTTSWNARNAYVLEITRWEAQPYDADGELNQVAGSASGRVAVAYAGGGDFANSWVAGTFEDVPIRYRGRPRWLTE